jgi:hypothetical protein
VRQQAGGRTVHREFNVALGPKRRVRGDRDPKFLGQSNQGFLSEVRVKFDLQDLGLNASVAEHIQDEGTLAVAVPRDECQKVYDTKGIVT